MLILQLLIVLLFYSLFILYNVKHRACECSEIINKHCFICSLIWMLEPAVLTIISVSLLVLALIDYIVPPVTSVLCPVYSWTGQKEKKFNEICQNLSVLILQLQCLWKTILQTRNDRPNVVS